MSTGAGLRERKKQRTRATIARVALELFDRQGFQATTIPQIAAAADVAPRTVSAYFPAKEELVFPDEAERLARLAARLRERPPGESAPEALRAWIAAELPDWLDDDDRLRAQARVIAADERLRAYERRYVAPAERLVAEAIADDLGCSPAALEPRIAAAATVAAFDVLRAPDDGPRRSFEEALAMVDRALAFVSAGIRALSGDG